MKSLALSSGKILLVLILAGGAFAESSAQRKDLPRSGRKGSSVKELESGLKTMQREKSKTVRELKKVSRAVRVVKGDLNSVEGRLVELEEKLDETTEALSSSRSRQVVLAKELSKATSSLAVIKEQVRRRLRQLYVRGEDNFLSVLVSSKSTGDIASRKFLLDRIAKRDRDIFSAYIRYRKLVEDKKQEQDRVVRRIAGLADTQQRQQDSLEEVREEKKEILGGLRNKQSELREIVRQFEEDEATIRNEIQAAIRRAQELARRTGKPLPVYRGGRLMAPCRGRITSGFGMRFHPIQHRYKNHDGIDFGAPTGTPVLSAADGVVIAASRSRGYGNRITVDHGSGMMTVYAHLSRMRVSVGAVVKRGQVIGAVGSTGMSTGPHLHFEVRINGRAVNPRSYL